MYQLNLERRRDYHAPQLIQHGTLETITAGSGCSFEKIGSMPDDSTLVISALHGDELCDPL